MCNRLTKLSVTMWYTFFGIFDDTSLWILPKTHDPSLCDTPDELQRVVNHNTEISGFGNSFNVWSSNSYMGQVVRVFKPGRDVDDFRFSIIQE